PHSVSRQSSDAEIKSAHPIPGRVLGSVCDSGYPMDRPDRRLPLRAIRCRGVATQFQHDRLTCTQSVNRFFRKSRWLYHQESPMPDLYARLRALTYFQNSELPKLESDYDMYDLSEAS